MRDAPHKKNYKQDAPTPLINMKQFHFFKGNASLY